MAIIVLQLNLMPPLQKIKKINSLSAIHSYELSRLEQLPLATVIAIASELTAALQTLRISKENSDKISHQNQAAYYLNLKMISLERKNQVGKQVSYGIASIMHCIYKADEIDGLQNNLITTTLNWVRDSIAKSQI
jgi:hypothetical protein